MLINEGGGAVFDYGDRRLYGVCCGEKGVFRFSIIASGVAGHASLPRMGDNALLKLGPVLTRLAAEQPSFDVTEGPAALLRGIGEDPDDPAAALRAIAAVDPRLLVLIEPMLGVTLTPTMASASEKINVIPSQARISVDCRVPPGLGEDVARERIGEVLGDDTPDLRIEFIDSVIGNLSAPESPLMDAVGRWVAANDPGASAVPVILPGFSDSRWFREAFPDCVAYGFFPHRHMNMFEVAPLVHSADERIDVRDLDFAARFYADMARELLG
jgi:acetylornithine deacetylase/succinyl-diaminopimelate desuccinylase-like protein